MENFKKHAEVSGSKILTEMVASIKKIDTHFLVVTSSKKEFTAKKVVLAT
jgi:thioredoxin reductase